MVKDVKKEISSLKKELSLLKRNFRDKYGKILNELQEIGYKHNYEFVREEEPTTYLDNYYERLIEKVKPNKTFKDVIFSNELRKQIDMIIYQVQNHDLLLSKFGLKKLQESNAISLNFSGPPGTGKTLTAEALAYELKKKLYIVRYSNLVDSYIGETGKNIVKVFEIARKDDAILFFDEADAIASTRTQIFSSSDSETNLTRNVLLKELEKFKGIVIFATNLAGNFDKAFERRINLHIIFKVPDIKEREQIFKLLSHGLPLSKDIDFYDIATRYEFSGGHIRNAIINAARIAIASKKDKVTQEDFIGACNLVKEGKALIIQDTNDKGNLNYLG